jgi:outer membrane receptor for ferrienterochelin and colicins
MLNRSIDLSPAFRRGIQMRALACGLFVCGASWPLAPAIAQESSDEAEDEEIVVEATRTGRRVQDEPIRVEVLNREEIEEKLLMTPGNISMLVAETGGVRVQVTSPSLGSSSIRMQGMKGRYTSLLADGLPLYGGQASSIGLLQIAPTDLGQVEIIKGSASALYGPAALGGMINLVSRRPGPHPEMELLGNATTRDGQDFTAYAATPLGTDWGASLVGGIHRQSLQDLEDDGWADIAGYRRWTIRPRIFWNGSGGASLYATFGAMHEDREGGTVPGRNAPDGLPFAEAQKAQRLDAGVTAKVPIEGLGVIHLRASAVRQTHVHGFGNLLESDRHSTLFAEAALSGESGGTNWLIGLAWQQDAYRSDTFAAFDYAYNAPAVLGQVEYDIDANLTLAASGRLDFHSEYGTRLSPRLSALYKPGAFTIRATFGHGYYAPSPFVEEIEATGLSRLEPLSGVKAETASTASFDVNYVFGSFEAGVVLFASNLRDAVRVEELSGSNGIRLINVSGVTRNRGAELLLRYREGPFSVTGSYVHTDAREPDLSGTGQRFTPRTPRNTAGLVAMWEKHGKGRIGVEAYYTGPQELDDNPYRPRSRTYWELGLLGEVVLGRFSLFVNAENLLNVRQTKYDPILRTQRAADGRWTVDAWAPLEGFTVNAGIRLKLGGD